MPIAVINLGEFRRIPKKRDHRQAQADPFSPDEITDRRKPTLLRPSAPPTNALAMMLP
jgi:hypothetical protein